ncbi:MAG: hypothetical protein E7352_00045 [Clostridiales bacterium]|nr:hypothetical protein [Clostridiales bacterium]
MELLFLYETISVFVGLFGRVDPTDTARYANSLLIQAIISIGVGLAFFILQGFAVYCMAKKRGVRRKGLAFVPFANIILIGKLAGETTFFGQKMKRTGLYTMIAQIFVSLLALSYIFVDVYLHQSGCIGYVIEEETIDRYRQYWVNGTPFQEFLFEDFFDIVYLLNMIFGLLCEILMLILLSALYKQYAPDKHTWLTILTLFIPIARCIILFVLRRRKAVDYQAHMRAKYDAYMRQYHQRYGQNGGYNPYGGYGPQGYGQPNYGPQNGQPNAGQGQREDPFSEFSTKEKADDPFAEFSSDKKENDGENSDGFFD